MYMTILVGMACMTTTSLHTESL